MQIEIRIGSMKQEEGVTVEMGFEMFLAAKFGVEPKNIIRVLLCRRNVDETANEEAANEFIAFCSTVENYFEGKGEIPESTRGRNKMSGNVIFNPGGKNGKINNGFLIATRASDDRAAEYYSKNYLEMFPLEIMRHYDIFINDKILSTHEAALEYISELIEKSQSEVSL